MPRADRAYQQPSRSSRFLITFLAITVVLLAGWIVVSNTILVPRGTIMAATPAADPTAAPVQEALPEIEQTAAIEPAPQLITDSPAAEPMVEGELAPSLPEPIVVASAQGVPLPVPPMLPSLASSRTRLIELDTQDPQAGGVTELVPLPPRRPKAASIPLPRPRPDTEVAVDRASSPVLSDAEIARMH